MDKRIFTVSGEVELQRCYPLMKELRPHLNLEEFLSIYRDAHVSDGYEIVAVENEKQILALMGYRFLTDYVRGRHLYIDDLVTTQKIRSQGLGAELLKLAESIAKKNGCASLRLCTGIENERGVMFYERNGWRKRSFAFVKNGKIDIV